MVVRLWARMRGSIGRRACAAGEEPAGKNRPAHGGGKSPEKRSRGDEEIAAGGVRLVSKVMCVEVNSWTMWIRYGSLVREWIVMKIRHCTSGMRGNCRMHLAEQLIASCEALSSRLESDAKADGHDQARLYPLTTVHFLQSASADWLCEERNTRSTV